MLTGQGHVFSSGADLTDAAGVAEELPDKAKALNIAIDQAPVPVIGAINGPAIGAGVILAMICDLRVVAPDAYFQFPVAKYGLALDNWSIRRLTSLVGAGRARGMLLGAERLTAEAALHTGMANRIGTLADAQAWAAEIAGYAPLALQHAKRVLNDDGAYEDPWPEHTGAVRPGLGQPGRHRGAGGAHREAATEVPGRLMMLGAALRIGFGTATLLAGGWALRALQGTPSALGAPPVEIDGVAKRSPNYRDGVFVNLEPASPVSLTRQEQFLLVREVIGGSSRQQPSEPVPLVTPDPSLAAGDLAVTWYGHSSAVIEIDGYRVLADPVWSDRCSPSRTVGPQRLHPVPAPAGGAARDRRGDHQPRPLRPPRHRHDQAVGTHSAGQVLRAARHRCPSAVLAHPRRPDRRARLERERPTGRPHAGVHAGAAFLRTLSDPQHHAVVVVGAHRTRATARSSAATPDTRRASPTSAPSTDRSTSP